jgi:dsDNA-specific endonuclease/ATPase MutS2
MHNYWIGDRVWIASLHQAGVFEGEQDDMAIVKADGSKKLFAFADISLMQEEEEDFELEALGVHSKPKAQTSFDFPDSIDLHIEELNPKLVHAEPALILAHQRSRLKDYLTAALYHHKRQVIIIHGKGEGVLRSEVLSILKEYPEIKRIEDEGHGGAVKVIFI